MRAEVLVLLAAFPACAADCDSLKTLRLDHTTINVAEAREPGDLPNPNGGRAIPHLPAFCRVAGNIKPTADSDIRFEVWMPASGWNGKFQGVGNGGYAGIIGYGEMADALTHSYATASTDTGHQPAQLDTPDATWALNHPEKVADFGYRAIHETAVAAKQIIRAYYGDAPKHSYFNSCSNGGRQALMEAERFPADYDGIIAGAPANDWTHLLSAGAYGAKAMLGDPAGYIPAAKLPAIQANALAQCDAVDGVKDGLIEDPLACRIDLAPLRCKGAETNACLTGPQLTALEAIYGGLKNSRGQQLFPGLSPGGEAEDGAWGQWVTGRGPKESAMYFYSTQFFRNMVYNDPKWQFAAFDSDRTPRDADDKLASVLNSANPDLAAFRARGGRLLLYHGWADAAIPARSTVNFYQRMAEAGPVESFARLYMIPGMAHCGGGGGFDIGGKWGAPHGDPEHDLDAALEAWVEKGVAPGTLIGSHVETGKVTRTHPLCPWPATARWDGKGSPDDAASFSCVKP
jgi:feruloyl esterase